MSTTYQLTTIQGDTVRHARFATLESMRTAARRIIAAVRRCGRGPQQIAASEYHGERHDITRWLYTWTPRTGWTTAAE